MERDARIAVKKEFIMGTTSEDSAAQAVGVTAQQRLGDKCENNEDTPVPPVEPPAIADVCTVISQIATVLLVSTSSTITEDSFAVRPVAADALDLIVHVCELLDQVYSWAVEEGSTFVDLPSQLAEVGAPHVVVACLACERPRILAAVLCCVQEMLRHPQSCSELLREVAARHGCREEGSDIGSMSSRTRTAVAAFVADLTAVLKRHGGVVSVVLPALAVATALTAFPGAAEAALREGMVSEVLNLSRVQSHRSAVAIAVADFLAALVQVPECEMDLDARTTRDDDTGGEPRDEIKSRAVPTAVLVTHVGVVLPMLVALARQHRHHLMLKRAVCRVFLACARHPENRLRLVAIGAYGVVVDCFQTSRRVPDVFAVCAETIGYCVPWLQALQARQLIRVVRDALLATGGVEQQTLLLALVLSLARASAGGADSLAKLDGPFAAYQLYPLPPNTLPPSAAPAHATSVAAEIAATTKIKLQASDVLFSPSDKAADVLGTMRTLSVPQLVGHMIDFYRTHDGSDVDAREVQKTQRAVRLAEQCLGLLSRPF